MAWVLECAIAAVTEVPGPVSGIAGGVIGEVNRGVYTGVVVINGEVSYWSSCYHYR